MLVLVLSGRVDYGSTSYNKGQVFSSDFVYPDTKINSVLAHNLVAQDNAKVALLSVERFSKIIGGTMEQAIVKNKDSHEVPFLSSNPPEKNGNR